MAQQDWVPYRPNAADLKRIAEDVAEVRDIQQTLLAKHKGVRCPDRVAHQYQIAGSRVTLEVALDLPAQVADMNVDDASLDGVFVAPDRVQDLLPAEHLSGVAGKKGQQVELGVGQLDFLACLVGPPLVDVDHELSERARQVRHWHGQLLRR